MNYTSKKLQYTLPNGTIAYFSRYKFKCAIHKAISSNDQKISMQEYYEEMADSTGNSVRAIKHWSAGHNAPSDLEKLQAIADYLNTELIELLETETENKTMTNTTPIKVIDFSEIKNSLDNILSSLKNVFLEIRDAASDLMLYNQILPQLKKVLLQVIV